MNGKIYGYERVLKAEALEAIKRVGYLHHDLTEWRHNFMIAQDFIEQQPDDAPQFVTIAAYNEAGQRWMTMYDALLIRVEALEILTKKEAK